MNWSLEEIGGITRVPFPVTIVEVKLHEVTEDGGEEHLTGLASNGVVEFEYSVVARTTIPYSKALVAREYVRHRFRHRRLLRHV